jgi:thioredoxin 1
VWIEKGSGMIVYDVWAEWCAPCKKFAPIFDAVSKKFEDVQFAKVEADLNFEFLNRYSINSIPTLLITDDSGNELFSHAGIMTQANLEMLVSTFLLQSHK